MFLPDALTIRGARGFSLTTIQDVLTSLEAAVQAVSEAAKIESTHDNDITAYDDAITLCESIGRNAERVKAIAERRYRHLNVQPATERMMTNFIVKQVVQEPKDKATVKVAKDFAGGIIQGVLRRAHGKCEICGSDWHVSAHHIIPRADGGLSLEDNLIALCNSCHNEVEDKGYHSRPEVLRHKRSKAIPIHNAEPDDEAEAKRATIAEKSAATKAANAIKDMRESQEVAEWAAKWDTAYWRTVVFVPLGHEPPTDPEWYAVVYGGAKLDDIPRHRR